MAYEILNQTPLRNLVENNIITVFKYLMQKANYQWNQFGAIYTATTPISLPDMNYIFFFRPHHSTYTHFKKALSFAKTSGVPYSLLVPELSSYPTMASLLTEYNYKKQTDLSLMAFNLKNALPSVATSDITIKKVTQEVDFATWTTIADQAFQLPENSNRSFFQPMGCIYQSSNVQFYLACKGSVPVGTALIYAERFSKIVGSYWWGVLPQYQHHGIETYMIHQLLQEVKKQQLQWAVAQCLPTSSLLAENLGFIKQGHIDCYTNN